MGMSQATTDKERARIALSYRCLTLTDIYWVREAFEIYAVNHDVNPIDYILNLDTYSYYMMNILDYLVGNTDRHWGNWGFLVDNRTGQTIRLHDLMDFNQSFLAYDTIEGAGCLTTGDRTLSQKDAAIEAVNQIGLNQIAEVQPEWFAGREEEYQMFRQRLQLLTTQGCQMAAENVYVKTYP